MIFGVGPGLFLILTLWILAILIFLISLRVEKKIGAIAIFIVSILTIILISVPRASEKPTASENKLYDKLFIWRIILLVVLLISSLVGFFAYVKCELMETIRPIRVYNWVI